MREREKYKDQGLNQGLSKWAVPPLIILREQLPDLKKFDLLQILSVIFCNKCCIVEIFSNFTLDW